MKLKDCTYGKLVVTRKDELGDCEVGIIVGITNNCPCGDINERSDIDRAIPLVKWSSGRESGIHPAQIDIFKG